jgi:transposase
LLKPATLEQSHAVIDTLVEQIAILQEQVALLQERAKLDSRNSSKPPSSDGPGSGNRAQRRASLRKRGAQKGHPGSYRALVDVTDRHIGASP